MEKSANFCCQDNKVRLRSISIRLSHYDKQVEISITLNASTVLCIANFTQTNAITLLFVASTTVNANLELTEVPGPNF